MSFPELLFLERNFPSLVTPAMPFPERLSEVIVALSAFDEILSRRTSMLSFVMLVCFKFIFSMALRLPTESAKLLINPSVRFV